MTMKIRKIKCLRYSLALMTIGSIERIRLN